VNVRLHDPLLLLLLLLLPLLLRRMRARRHASLRFPVVSALSGVAHVRRARWQWVPAAMRALAFGLLVISLARPQVGKSATRVNSEGIDIMLAVDVSGSMLAEDFEIGGKRVNRLEAVKSVVAGFLEKRPGDRVGLVLFAGRPYSQCPLTLDHGWLLQNLNRAEIGMIEDGTAIGSALATAVKRLEASDAKTRIVILLTDGQSNAGKIPPATAADAAKALGYRVYTIGAGTRGLAPFPQTDPFGNRVYVPTPVDIDEETLRAIAQTTGGRYYRATDLESLQGIYAEINDLEKSPYEGLQYLDYTELYPWLALPAFLLLLAESVLVQSWLRVLP
jgi:Ca-activated chloride channel family protein